MLRKFLISTTLISPLALAGCGGKIPIVDNVIGSSIQERKDAGKLRAIAQKQEVPPSVLLNSGIKEVNRGEDEKAQKAFNEVAQQHPFSSEAQRALVLSAYTHFTKKQYSRTISKAKQFIQLYPGNKDAAYMQYLIGESYSANVSSVVLDQGDTQKGLQAYRDLIRLYPQSKFAGDSKQKVLFLADQLAGKEMQIGRYYQERRQHLAAVNRFKGVVEQHQKTRHVEEALYRLTESYLALGLVNDARSATSLLGHNYPESQWYSDAYNLASGRGVANNKKGIVKRLSDLVPLIQLDDSTGYKAPDSDFIPTDGSASTVPAQSGTANLPDVPGLESGTGAGANQGQVYAPVEGGRQALPVPQNQAQKKRGLSRFVPFIGKKDKPEQNQDLISPSAGNVTRSGGDIYVAAPAQSGNAEAEEAVEEQKNRSLTRFIPFVGKKDKDS